MTENTWIAVDDYFEALFTSKDKDLEAALDTSAGAGMTTQQITASQGKFLLNPSVQGRFSRSAPCMVTAQSGSAERFRKMAS